MKSGRSKVKVVAIAVVAMALIAAIILLMPKSTKGSNVSIMLAPYDNAVATIRGKDYKSGNYELSSGTNIQVTITAPGYKEKTLTIDIDKQHIATVYAYLESEDNGLEYCLKSDKDMKILTLLGNDDEEAQKIIARNKKKAYISNELPIIRYYGNNTTGGSMGAYPKMIIEDARNYGYDCINSICLYVQGQKGDDAAKELEKRGYNINDYEVYYEE